MKPFRRGDSALWLCMGWWSLLDQSTHPDNLRYYDDRCQLWIFNDVPIMMIYRYKLEPGVMPGFPRQHRRFDNIIHGRGWILWLNADDGRVKGFRGDGERAVQDLTMMRLHFPGR